MRTGRIGLAAFLNKARLPDYPLLRCQCGRAEETAEHVIAYCPRFTEQRRSLAADRLDVKALTSTAEGAKRLTRWFLRLRILPQFHLAEELLREEEEGEEIGGPGEK